MCWGRCEIVSLFLMLINLWTVYLKEQLNRINKKVYKNNGRGGPQENGQFWKLRKFSWNFFKNIGCLL